MARSVYTLMSVCFVVIPDHAPAVFWWSQTGSNRRPHACKARALPAELWPRLITTIMRPLSPKLSSTGTLRFGLLRGCATRSLKGEAWWAWEDLNFRPHAYQARA